MRMGMCGRYKDQYLRSYSEFIFAVYLDTVLQVSFVTEPFSLQSAISTKRKIPDFLYKDTKYNISTIVEIKDTDEKLEEVILDYATNSYKNIQDYNIRFVNLNKKAKKHMIITIINTIGINNWNEMSTSYKKNSKSTEFYGFPGELNPRYGIKLTDEIKNKIKKSLPSKHGMNNPHYGKTHSTEAKIKIGSKWQNDDKKHSMQRKGMITHINSFNDTQYQEFVKYADSVLSGIPIIKPSFVNNAYAISINKINLLFGDAELFKEELIRR